MEQIGKDIEKVLKAGIGAVTTGVEKSAEVIEKLAQKGEPLYNQAKTSVCDAAGKIKKAVDDSNISTVFGCKPSVSGIISSLRQLSQPELDAIRKAIDEIYPSRPAAAQNTGDAENGDQADANPTEQDQSKQNPPSNGDDAE